MTNTAQAAEADMRVSDELMIEVSGLHKWFGQFHVLMNIDLSVYKGERIVVCGP
jgi:general L-amino acid transport system ATP-binding protein